MCELKRPYIIRADANELIGSGHMMRCLSIAKAINSFGYDVKFVVSGEDSSFLPVDCGFKTTILASDYTKWVETDGLELGKLASNELAVGVLVDSYAVTDDFFSGLRGSCPGISVGYIDDLYSFEYGRVEHPIKREVDIVFNYGFCQYEEEYAETYSGTETQLCLGLKYAPLRPEFTQSSFAVNEKVRRVLITTGSTNPDHTLERMAKCVCSILPNAAIEVVVGSMAGYESSEAVPVVVNKGVKDLSFLMYGSDLAVSAAGTTLYELCAVGLPTIAIPIVDNQLPNAEGLSKRGLGFSCAKGSFEDDLLDALQQLSFNEELRRSKSICMAQTVDGNGSARIASCLLFGQNGDSGDGLRKYGIM